MASFFLCAPIPTKLKTEANRFGQNLMVNSTHMMSVVARSLVKTRVLAKSPPAILATVPARSFSAGLSGPRLALPPLMSQRDTQALQWPRRPHNSFAAHEMHGAQTMYATTILCVRKGDEVVVIGDGQVTQGSFVVKDNARKVATSAPPPPSSPLSLWASLAPSVDLSWQWLLAVLASL